MELVSKRQSAQKSISKQGMPKGQARAPKGGVSPQLFKAVTGEMLQKYP